MGRSSPKGAGIAALLSKEQNSELRKIIIECVQIAKKDLYAQVNVLEQKALKSEKDVADLQEKMATTEAETALVKSKVTAVQKQQNEQERHLISLLWEHSQNALRLQNVEEEEGEIVGELVSRLLAPLSELPEPQFTAEPSSAYRVATRYTETHGLPKEIHLKLSGKEIRNKILYNANQNQLEYQGSKVIILKDVPPIVRKKREPFRVLAKKLLDKGITYRWLIPQGLSFSFKGETVKIISERDIDSFLGKHRSDFQEEEVTGAATMDSDKKKAQQKPAIEKRVLRSKKK